MADRDLGITLKLYLENGQLKAGLVDAEGKLHRFGATGKRAGEDAAGGLNETGRAADKTGTKLARLKDHASTLTRGFRDLRRAVLVAFVVHEAIEFTGAIVDANVEMQRIHYTFQAATGSAAAARKEWKFASQAAHVLGLDVRVAAIGLGQMEAAAAGAHIPLQKVRDLWLAVAKAQVVYHLSAEQSKTVMLALTQMMAKGKIQSQELQLQLSQSLPIGVLSRFAAAIGITVTQLQKMMQNGELLTSKYLPALSHAIETAVDPKSLSEAEHGLNAELNRLKTTIFGIEAGPQSTFADAFTRSIQDLNVTLNDPGVQQGLTTLIDGLGQVVSLLIKGTSWVVKFSNAFGNFVVGGMPPTDALAQEQADLKKQRALKDTYQKALSSSFYRNAFGPKIRDMSDSELRDNLRVAENRAKLARMAIARIKAQRAQKANPADKPAQGQGDKRTPPGITHSPASAALVATQKQRADLEAQSILLKAALDKRKASLEDRLKHNEISYKAYYAAIVEIQRASIAQQIKLEQAKIAELDAKTAKTKAGSSNAGSAAAAAKAAEKRAQLVAHLTVLENQLGDVGAAAARKQADANRNLDKQLDAVKQKLLSITDPVKAAKAKIETQYAELIAQLKAQGRTADLKLVMHLEVAEENKAAVGVIRDKARTVVNKVRAQQQTLANKVRIGALSPAAAQTSMATGQQQAINQLDALIAEARSLHTALGAQLVAALAKSKAAILGLKPPVGQIVTQIASGLLGNTQQFFQALVSGTARGKDAIKSFGAAVLKMLEQIATKMLAMQALQAILGAFGYQMSPTGTVAAIPAHAEGGPIRGPGTATSDSILARLSNGEFVLKAQAVTQIVKHHGMDWLKRLNQGVVSPGFASGGYVGYVGGASSAARAAGGSNLNISIPVTVTGDTGGDSGDDVRRGKQLGQALQQAVQKEILKQQRPGGLLYAPAGA